MNKDEVEDFITQTRIEQGIAKGVRVRCYGVWSIAVTAVAGISSWISSHFQPVKDGFQVFWTELWKN